MKLIFDDRAIGDLESIYHWIARDSPKAAKAVHEERGEVIVIAVFHGAQDWETRLKARRDPAG